jgi:hypothetical protein
MMVLRGSLSLLGMECGLLRLQIGDHFLCSIDRELITDREQYPPITLNGVVDVRTLFTHHCRLVQAEASGHLSHTYDGGSVLFQSKLRTLQFQSGRLLIL